MEKLLLDGKWELHYAPEHAGKTTAQAVKEDPAYTHIEANVPGNAELDLYAAGKHRSHFGERTYMRSVPMSFTSGGTRARSLRRRRWRIAARCCAWTAWTPFRRCI